MSVRPLPDSRSSNLPVAMVTPVWGARYVARFLDRALPSWLAPANLPRIAQSRPVELWIVTRAEDWRAMACHPAMRRAQALGRVHCVEMDDLVSPGHVPVTLTLCYQRGLAACCADGERLAVLLNSDFVVSENAISTVADHLAGGARLVLAPSLRVNEEGVQARLLSAFQPDGALALSGRALVAAALPHLHHTVLSSRMDQQVLHSTTPHQLYWRPEPDTLVARGFCLFTAGLRVRAPLPPAAAFCDYGMAALLAPGAAPVILADSDAFTALEVAPGAQEIAFTRAGPPEEAAIIRILGGWTTAFHRQQAGVPLVFHAGGIGPQAEQAVQASQQTVLRLLAQMAPPLPLEGHPIWAASVRGWLVQRRLAGLTDWPPELARPDAAEAEPQPAARPGWRLALRRALLGGDMTRRVWQPHHRAARALSQHVGAGLLLRGAFARFSFKPAAALGGGAPEAASRVLFGVDLGLRAMLPAQSAALAAEPDLPEQAGLYVFWGEGGVVTPHQLAEVLGACDGWFVPRTVTVVPDGPDVEVEHLYGCLAERGALRRPLATLALAAAAAWGSLRMVWANLGPGAARAAQAYLVAGTVKRAPLPASLIPRVASRTGAEQ